MLKKMKKYIFLGLCAAIVSIATSNYTNVYAVVDSQISDREGTNKGADKIENENNNDYVSNHETENALYAAGLTSTDLAKDIFDIKDSDGEPISAGKLESIKESGGNINIKLEYKNTELSKNLASIFGEDTNALQNYITKTNSNSVADLEKNLSTVLDIRDKINNIQKQIGSLNGATTNSNGQISITGDLIELIASASKQNGGTLQGNSKLFGELKDLLTELQKLTGISNIANLTPEQCEIILGQIGNMQNASVILTAASKTYFALSKIVISATDSNGNTLAISPNQSRTAELLNKYSATVMSKYKSITGKDCPTITSAGGNTWEINFLDDIEKTPNAVNNIINKWVCDNEGFFGMVPAAAFTCTQTADEITVKLTLYADKYVYKEKISTGVYPSGDPSKNNIIKDNFNVVNAMAGRDIVGFSENNYSWENYKNSYFYSYEPLGFNQYVFSVKYSSTLSKTKNVAYASESVQIPFTNWDEGKNEEYTTYKTDYKLKSTAVKYPTAEYVSVYKNRPLISTSDGEYVRNIWFKAQQIRYWDYKEEPKVDGEVYEPWVLTKYNTTELKNYNGEHYLVSFPSADKQKKGYILTKERATYRYPDPSKVPGESIVRDRRVRTWVWKLAPLKGLIEIPVTKQTGNVSGVISDADMNIK